MKRYKLLKDLPTFKAGDEFELREDGCLYYTSLYKDLIAYHRRTLERFPNILKDWFEEIEEPKEDGLDHIITLIEAYSSHNGEYYPKEIVEKLKAWTRLRDKGFRLVEWGRYYWTGEEWPHIDFSCPNFDDLFDDSETIADLDLLFGGEE